MNDTVDGEQTKIDEKQTRQSDPRPCWVRVVLLDLHRPLSWRTLSGSLGLPDVVRRKLWRRRVAAHGPLKMKNRLTSMSNSSKEGEYDELGSKQVSAFRPEILEPDLL